MTRKGRKLQSFMFLRFVQCPQPLHNTQQPKAQCSSLHAYIILLTLSIAACFSPKRNHRQRKCI